ncbi:hypothetical protein QVD17_14862 [Tagetes erecta]|uniref:Late embryogenesis abundant protein LEA-2 subgroup domain-containing protein n=1 Tax=Tagetes erecta TaxID=13708 RepID=A0AAD8KNQ5_TARER|nr:hypothetical protein QVD17_14862 [Tagetes erecta]
MSPSPAQLKSYHHPGRRSNTAATCNPITCCCSCIFNCIINLICQIIITVAIIITITVLIFCFIFHPNVPKFYVDDVTLTQFTLSPNNTLFYNLKINMTFRNPNRRLGIYYEQIEVNGLYHGQRFLISEIEGFYLGNKEENNVSLVVDGEQLVVNGGVKSKYESEKNDDDVYEIELKLRLKMRFKVLWVETPKFKPRFDCELKVPLSRVSNARFERTKCGIDWYKRIW